MPFTKIKAWRVTITGEFITPAEDGETALALAREFFATLSEGVGWSLEEITAHVKDTE